MSIDFAVECHHNAGTKEADNRRVTSNGNVVTYYFSFIVFTFSNFEIRQETCFKGRSQYQLTEADPTEASLAYNYNILSSLTRI
jgi:hypothetical protein